MYVCKCEARMGYEPRMDALWLLWRGDGRGGVKGGDDTALLFF